MLVERLLRLSVFFTIIPSLAIASPVTLSDVPAYSWYHGCGPTSAGSVIGYWDLHGYPNLFDAGGSDVFLTANVQDQISSPAHDAKYDSTPDIVSLPTPPMTSIADWFLTSVDPTGYGESYLSYADDAFTGYANYRGYTFNAWDEAFGTQFTWNDLTNEINAGRPMMFLVDSSGDGVTDHFVPVLGYDDRGAGGQWYGLYTTWSEAETIVWEPFRGMSSSYGWGIGVATFIDPLTPSAIPEPTTMLLIGLGLIGLAGARKSLRLKSD